MLSLTLSRLNSLPPSLRLDGQTNKENKLSASLRFILHGHLLDCYEAMYWPFIVEAIHGSLRQSAVAQDFVQKGLQLCIDRIDKNEQGFCNRHHGTWFMLRSCTRSALVLIAAAKSRRLCDILPKQWKDTVSKVIMLLRYWKDETRDCADRLRILEDQMLAFADSPQFLSGASTQSNWPTPDEA